MRRSALILFLLACASPAWASASIMLLPDKAVIQRGQIFNFVVVYRISGTNPGMNESVFHFETDRPEVLQVPGHWSLYGGDITVAAISPGTAKIYYAGHVGDPLALLATIEVRCDYGVRVRAAVPRVTTQRGVPVTLQLAIEGIEDPQVEWLAGLRGDPLHTLATGGTSYTFEPLQPGTQYVWARVWSECGYAEVEFRIDVLPTSRRRAAGR